VLRAQIAAAEGHDALAVRLLRSAVGDAPHLIQEHLPALLRLAGPRAQDALLAELIEQAGARGAADLKRLVFAALSAGFADAPPLRPAIESVFSNDAMLHEVWRASADRPDVRVGDALRVAHEIRALLVHAERFRCSECGFAGRNFYWHCPACHAWDSFEAHAIVNFS
jgi:lipopolysaccharide biosynthesis regulator YciM